MKCDGNGKLTCSVASSYLLNEVVRRGASYFDVLNQHIFSLFALFLAYNISVLLPVFLFFSFAVVKENVYFLILQGSLQEVTGWGLTGWKYYANVIGPIQCEGLANLGVTQFACAEKRFLILSRNGRVHTQAYNSDTLVSVLGTVPAVFPLGAGSVLQMHKFWSFLKPLGF